MRINKYLAFKKYSPRRGADELIEQKQVFINGKLAKLGDKVNEKDKVEVKGNIKKEYKYFAYNKPIGLMTEDISESGLFHNVFPLGRLDKNSHGLIILTNDGRITDQLLSPKYFHEKEYIVKTLNKLRSNFKQKMEAGVNIEGYLTKKCKVVIIDNFTFRVILTEGKKHQIRRMCSALFQETADLKRVRIVNINLGPLKPKTSREITGKELETFLNQILY